MNRRDFNLRAGAAAACGVIPIQFYENCREWLNNHNRPLLVPPPKPGWELLALAGYGGDDFQLNIGDPNEKQEIPELTWREYIENCVGLDLDKTSRRELREKYGCVFRSLDDLCPGENYADWFEMENRSESTTGLAYHYLEDLDLGPGFVRGGRVVGSLKFIDGDCPGNDYLGVHAVGAMSLSCLQERLNQLGEKVKIVVTNY